MQTHRDSGAEPLKTRLFATKKGTVSKINTENIGKKPLTRPEKGDPNYGKFCASNPAFADCATRPLRILIDVKDEKIKNRAISLAKNALIDQTPTGGKKREG